MVAITETVLATAPFAFPIVYALEYAGVSTGLATVGGAGLVPALGEGALVGLGALGGGGSAGIALATLAGPLGALLVGCKKNDDENDDNSYTWDCWKPIVRDTSSLPSNGITLRCLAAHPNVRSMSLDQGGLLVRNIFGERFRLTAVSVEGTLAFHASVLSS